MTEQLRRYRPSRPWPSLEWIVARQRSDGAYVLPVLYANGEKRDVVVEQAHFEEWFVLDEATTTGEEDGC